MMHQARALVVVAVLAAVCLAAAPYVTLYRLAFAAAHHNGEVMRTHVDTDAIRQGVYQQMVNRAQEVAGVERLQDARCVSPLLIDLKARRAALELTSPVGLVAVLAGTGDRQEAAAGSVPARPASGLLARVSFSRPSWGRFVVTLASDNGEPQELVFRRRRLSWALTGVTPAPGWVDQHLPLLDEERQCRQGASCSCGNGGRP